MAQDSLNITPITYADAGVDIDRANRTKKRIKYLAHKTFTRGVLSEIGGFGGLFAIDKPSIRSGTGFECGRGWHQAESRFRDEGASHHRRGPGEPLRE